MTSKIRQWPLDWHIHVTKFCDLYFDEKIVEYEDRVYWSSIDTHNLDKTHYITINLKFKIGNHPYLLSITNNEGSHFSCMVAFRHLCAFDPYVTDDGIYMCCSGDLAIPEEIGGMGGYDFSVTDIITFAEKVMIDDHFRREKDDDDDDEGENDPIEPFSPTNVVEPELLLV